MSRRYRPLLLAALLLALLCMVLWVTSAPGNAPRPGLTPAGAPAAGQPATTAQEPPRPRQFTMVAVGDLMTDRNVGKAIQSNGVHSILSKVRDLTSAADVSFANLECPLSTEGPHDPSNCCFRARPETVQVVLDGGFDIVSLANNHSLNAGRAGVLQTLDVLDKHKVLYCGARRDREKGGEPTFLTVGNPPVKLGFLAATDLSFEHGSYNKVATDRANLVAQIQATRPQCDLLFVSLHWGEEYQDLPNQRQKGTAHALVDAGADVILGHHPHTLQGTEVYNGKLILYSMGNFVFDQREGERMESAIFHLKWVEGWGWQVFAKPIWIPRSRMGPIYPSTVRRDKILARLSRISKPLGTTWQVQGGKAWLEVDAEPAR
jgi:poly-gamma-glutamate synthesis protein (capsule biosynthesis protein)